MKTVGVSQEHLYMVDQRGVHLIPSRFVILGPFAAREETRFSGSGYRREIQRHAKFALQCGA